MIWVYETSEASAGCSETVTLGFTLSTMTALLYVVHGTSFGRSTTAMVSRETHTSFSCSSRISILQTWLRFPIWQGRAVAVTMPEDTGRIWFALISCPRHTYSV